MPADTNSRDYDPKRFNTRERRLFAGFTVLQIAICAALEELSPDRREIVRQRFLERSAEAHASLHVEGDGRALKNELGKAIDEVTSWIERGGRLEDIWIIPLD
ncbi:MAG: hypothetical protein F4231_10175 [Acidimicrobiaceae bacterium]|nr:hypothetical protein [Acidimicrobiaceae bacterium]